MVRRGAVFNGSMFLLTVSIASGVGGQCLSKLSFHVESLQPVPDCPDILADDDSPAGLDSLPDPEGFALEIIENRKA